MFKNLDSNNVAIGYSALYNFSSTVSAISGRISGNDIAIGTGAGYNLTRGASNILIGNPGVTPELPRSYPGVTPENGAIRIGATGTHASAYIAGIDGVNLTSGVAVFVDATGKLGTVTSSRRFKDNIESMGSVSDKLQELRPVTFRYKESDAKGENPLQYGLIAEEVAAVFPELVQYDKEGKPFTVYYHLLTPMLLNELQKNQKQTAEVKAAQDAGKLAHGAEIRGLKEIIQQQALKHAGVEEAQAAQLASLTDALMEQKRLLSKMAAYIQRDRSDGTAQNANFTQR